MIAYDSRVTTDSLITSDVFDKHYCHEGIHFFCAGFTSCIEEFADAYVRKVVEVPKGLDLHCFVWDGLVLRRAAVDDGVLWSERMLHEYYAIGSGGAFALAAMDMGADARTAVKMAAKRDTGTGGKIRTFKLR